MAIGLGRHRIGRGDGDRGTGVALLADADLQRQRAQQRHAVLRRHALATAFAEQVLDVPAVAAGMHGHVLDDAQHRVAMSCGVVTITAPASADRERGV
ncbi:hypothetical protein G6F62_015324 [Rhizopus arrhizus]|nr:hypothetical protein G6F62_015324 [Rhizopus arrhizus]